MQKIYVSTVTPFGLLASIEKPNHIESLTDFADIILTVRDSSKSFKKIYLTFDMLPVFHKHFTDVEWAKMLSKEIWKFVRSPAFIAVHGKCEPPYTQQEKRNTVGLSQVLTRMITQRLSCSNIRAQELTNGIGHQINLLLPRGVNIRFYHENCEVELQKMRETRPHDGSAMLFGSTYHYYLWRPASINPDDIVFDLLVTEMKQAFARDFPFINIQSLLVIENPEPKALRQAARLEREQKAAAALAAQNEEYETTFESEH